jgi:hypothetical protein
MKILISVCFVLTYLQVCCFANLPAPTIDANSVWQGVVILPNETLFKFILNDLPGTICVLAPSTNGTLTPYLLGEKVLKQGTNLPALNATPTTLISTEISGDEAANISYIAIATASAGKTNDIRFTATETANTEILDNQIDWSAFDSRIASIKQQNPNLPSGTRFAVIQVASVLTITYQTFSQVKSAANIAGWGFSGGGTYLSQNSDLQNAYIVGVNLAYSPEYLGELFPQVPLNTDSNTNTSGVVTGGNMGGQNSSYWTHSPQTSQQIKQALENVVNIDISSKTKNSKGGFVQNLNFLKNE